MRLSYFWGEERVSMNLYSKDIYPGKRLPLTYLTLLVLSFWVNSGTEGGRGRNQPYGHKIANTGAQSAPGKSYRGT